MKMDKKNQAEFVNKVKTASTAMKSKLSNIADEKTKYMEENKNLLKLFKEHQSKNKTLEKDYLNLKEKQEEACRFIKNLQKEKQSNGNNNTNTNNGSSGKKRKIDKISKDNSSNKDSDTESDLLPFY